MKTICAECKKECNIDLKVLSDTIDNGDAKFVSDCCGAKTHVEEDTQTDYLQTLLEADTIKPYSEPFNEEKFAAEIAFYFIKKLFDTPYSLQDIVKKAYLAADLMLEEHRKRFPKKEEK